MRPVSMFSPTVQTFGKGVNSSGSPPAVGTVEMPNGSRSTATSTRALSGLHATGNALCVPCVNCSGDAAFK